MVPHGEIGFALVKIVAMLFFVLAFLLVGFYLIRRFSNAAGPRGNQDMIKVLAVHYLSPKEKLVLVNVVNQTLLVGVTPQAISKLSTLEPPLEPEALETGSQSVFAQVLGKHFKGGS